MANSGASRAGAARGQDGAGLDESGRNHLSVCVNGVFGHAWADGEKVTMLNKIAWVWLGVFMFACAGGETETPVATEADDLPDVLLGGKADAWDRLNSPERFARFLDEKLVYHLAELPLAGKANKMPWPASYWPTYQDSTNARWDGADSLSPMEKYDLAFNEWVIPPGFDELVPLDASCRSSEFDLEYYEKLGPAARWMSENRGHWRAHDGQDSDGDGTIDECDDKDGIDTWWGLCHAWTPAALIEEEPIHPVEFNGVLFYPSDLKALMLTAYDYSRAMVIGGRCRAQYVKRDENGRILDADCRDTNPGTFHIITANLLGRFGTGFAEDRTYNDQVWNQPVYAYAVDRVEEVDEKAALELLFPETEPPLSYPFNDDAKAWAEVEVTVQYVTESHPTREPILPNLNRYLRTDRYHYLLELDGEGAIIGGEWINGSASGPGGGFSNQPDFLWFPRGPLPNPTAGAHGTRDPRKNPHVSYSKVLKLFEESRAPR